MGDVEECALTVEFKAVNVYDSNAQPVRLARFRIAEGATTTQTDIEDIPCLSCPDPTETLPSNFQSTGLSPVAEATAGVCAAPDAAPAPSAATPTFTG